MQENHPKFNKKFKMYVEIYHKCGCPDIIIKADSIEHANQISKTCIHGNNYIALREVF